MEKLIFGTYLKILKDAYAKRISNEDLINELYDSVTEGTGVVNKENYVPTVAKTTASYISNMTANVLGLVVECGSRPDAKQRCMSFFKEKIIPRLKRGISGSVISKLSFIITHDQDMAAVDKERLLRLGDENTFMEFLVEIYLYTLNVSNILADYSDHTAPTEVVERNKRRPLRVTDIPESVQEAEIPYVTAIQAAYRDHDKTTNETIEKSPKHSEHFGRQRKSYYTAEFLRRSSRDAYAEEEESPFDLLEEETYEGVIETWDSEYVDGLARMNAVLSQAAKLSIDSSILCKETNWVTEGAKKGICHILVNEDRVKGWIKDE